MTTQRPARRAQDPVLSGVLSPAPFDFLKGRSILVTGGTGSFGQCFVRAALRFSKVAKIIVFSRDELKQAEMDASIKDDRLRLFIGDVRDGRRLERAFHGVDYVVHAAALKQVPTLEYNPFEAVLTNIVGSQHVINAAIDRGGPKVVALSTDKAVNPINLYGASKLCAEKLFIAGNSYAASSKARLSVVRYGNVMGSRGSVVPLFLEKRKEGVLPITDERMTRFWITLEQSIQLVLYALRNMHGGEVFVPKIPSIRMVDLAKAIAPECKIRFVGIRPGEKLHEVLLTEDESARAVDMGGVLVIKPQFPYWDGSGFWAKGRQVPPGFRFASDTNDEWLTVDRLRRMVRRFEKAPR